MYRIIEATTVEEIDAARALFEEYAAHIGVDLCFQDFAAEVRGLPGRYVPPGGGLFIALIDDEPVGCVALRSLEPPTVAELKRLYVRPSGRGHGVGLALAQRAIDRAREAGYQRVRLDTLSIMQDAQRLYRRMGFTEIPAYTHNPIPGATYLELKLDDGAR